MGLKKQKQAVFQQFLKRFLLKSQAEAKTIVQNRLLTIV